MCFQAAKALRWAIGGSGDCGARAKLQVPRKRPRKRIASSRTRLPAPRGPNQVWSYDFVHDACANGQKLKCLTVVDEFTRMSLAIDVADSIRSGRVVEVLSQLISVHGAPRYLRSDNGPESVSRAMLRWATDENVGLALIDPGKLWQNGVEESFNGKFRDECLIIEWFRNRVEAKVVIEQWRQHNNDVRPHSSLGHLTPNEFVRKIRSKDSGAVLQELMARRNVAGQDNPTARYCNAAKNAACQGPADYIPRRTPRFLLILRCD